MSLQRNLENIKNQEQTTQLQPSIQTQSHNNSSQFHPIIPIDEEAYTDSISRILKRDYFPDLVILKCKNAHLDALAAGDEIRAARLQRKLERLQQPDGVRREYIHRIKRKQREKKNGLGTQDAQQATPLPQSHSDIRADTPRLNENVASDSLFSDDETDGSDADIPDNFLLNTAENSGPKSYPSLSELPDESLSLDQFQGKYTSEDNKSFSDLISGINNANRQKYSWQWNGNKITGRRGADFLELKPMIDEDQSSTTALVLAADNRPNAPQVRISGARNGLLFKPTTGHLLPSAIAAAKLKEIKRSNTRLDLDETQDSGSANITEIQSPHDMRSSVSSSSPSVRGYSFVSGAPSPSPSELGVPPMTWGSLSATPVKSRFKMADTPKRDELHHKIVSQKSKRAKRESDTAANRITSAIPKFNTGRDVRRAILTPAGQRLLSRISSSKTNLGDLSRQRESSERDGLSIIAKQRDSFTPRASKEH
ncbi:nuclear protein DGCR14 [Kockiozyma suomiensis]|uniref:nuclear protein DGCR14 n=1 Tax=Kockiozyma suomiensis TaxID=1337062 RepID=UPI0033440603